MTGSYWPFALYYSFRVCLFAQWKIHAGVYLELVVQWHPLAYSDHTFSFGCIQNVFKGLIAHCTCTLGINTVYYIRI